MAGEIKSTAFGFDRQNALRAALKQIIADSEISALQQFRDYAGRG
jgi:hypothetical protein